MAAQGLSLSDMYSTYFWDMVFWMVIVQCLFVGMLIMPLPSNQVRGKLLKAIDGFWSSSPRVGIDCNCSIYDLIY